MSELKIYTCNAAWSDTTAGDENADLVAEFDKLKDRFRRGEGCAFASAAYIADFMWEYKAADGLPPLLSDAIRVAYTPLLAKLVKCGVSENITYAILGSLVKIIPDAVTALCLHQAIGDGLFAVHFVMHFDGPAVLLGKVPVETKVCLTLETDDGTFTSEEDVVTLFSGNLYMHIE